MKNKIIRVFTLSSFEGDRHVTDEKKCTRMVSPSFSESLVPLHNMIKDLYVENNIHLGSKVEVTMKAVKRGGVKV
jgi:hypothetical protein